MRVAVENNLKQFFAEAALPETDITEGAYQTAIYNTIDTVTGNQIQSFVLASPVGIISITTGEIGTLGDVNF